MIQHDWASIPRAEYPGNETEAAHGEGPGHRTRLIWKPGLPFGCAAAARVASPLEVAWLILVLVGSYLVVSLCGLLFEAGNEHCDPQPGVNGLLSAPLTIGQLSLTILEC